MVSLTYAGRIEDSLAFGERSLERGSSAGLLRLLGEVSNLHGSRLSQDSPGEVRRRNAAFVRAREVFEAAEKVEPGHKRSYTSWAFAHAMLSDNEGSREVARIAVQKCRGFWVDHLQRPSHMLPGLTSRPWHAPEDFPWIRRLEDRWRCVRAELEALQSGAAGSEAWPEVRGHDKSLTEGS